MTKMKITVEGPFKCGKSTVALEIKRSLEESFPDWNVEIADLDHEAILFEQHQSDRIQAIKGRATTVQIETFKDTEEI